MKNNIEKIRAAMPDEEVLIDLAELFKTFGDSTRIRILFALFEAETAVGDIAAILEMSESAVSHQLRILRRSKLVKSRREGKNIYYSLDDAHVRTMVDQGLEHVKE